MPTSNRSKVHQADPVFIGIDPGTKGGIVAIMPDGTVFGLPMPDSELDVWIWLNKVRVAGNRQVIAIIEKVHAMPKNGAVSMFTFGTSYGGLRMALTALGAVWEAVTPQAWQKVMGFPIKKGETKPQRKKRLRVFAQQLFPKLELWSQPKSLGKQYAVCDALILAEHCRRKYRGSV